MNVDVAQVKAIINRAVARTLIVPDPWLKNRRDDYAHLVGHDNPYYLAFYHLAQELEPKLSVELGTYRGDASAHLAAGYPQGLVLTVDIHREDKDAQQRAIQAASQYENLEYLNGWTWDAHIVFQISSAAADTPIDLLFIDAWHDYQYAIREWEIYQPMLADEALVICDDIVDADGTMTDMTRFWVEISNDYERFLDKGVHSGVPMGFFRYIR